VANPALNWRYVGIRTFTAGDIPSAHDAVYGLGTSVTYSDGTARTPGSGSAWTWLREQSGATTVAAYGNPPVNALAFRYIVAGTVIAPAYTILTPDVATQGNTVVYGMQRNAGAYTTWSSATPFTNAGFSGYWRSTRAFSTVLYDSVSMWESQEGCVIQYSQSSTGNTSSVAFGALFDPLSVNASNAETDGRIYTMWGSGSLSVTSATWASTTTDGGAWSGYAVANCNHAGTFAPGTAVMFGGAGVQTLRFGTFVPTTYFTSTSGAVPRVNLIAWNVNGTFLGQSRQWGLTRDTLTRIEYAVGATPSGYLWAPSMNTTGDSVILVY